MFPAAFTAGLFIPAPPAAGGGGAVTFTEVSTLSSTAGATSYAASAFTPTPNTFLIAFVAVTASTLEGVTMSGGGLTWNKQGLKSAFGATSQHSLHCFTAEVGGSPASTTPTFDCTGDAGSACLISVVEVAGLHATEVDTSGIANDIATNTTPPINLGSTPDGSQPVIAAFASADAAVPTGITAPTNWTSFTELNQTSPTCAMQVAYRVTGETDPSPTFTGDGDGTDYPSTIGIVLNAA